MYYYKTNLPHHVAAVRQFERELEDMAAEARKFAALFGSSFVPVYSRSLHGKQFHGVRFSSSDESRFANEAIWKRGADRGDDSFRPRVKVAGELKLLAKELNDLWNKNSPTLTASTDVVYGILGLDWGSFFFSSGISWFEHQGFFYFQSGVGDRVGETTEILASEFYGAKQAVAAA